MPVRTYHVSIWAIFCLLLVGPAAWASSGDQVHFGQSITVGEGESTGDLVCIGCSIEDNGNSGDIVAIGGSVTLNGDARGDVVAIGGAIHLGDSASVAGDVTTVGGKLFRRPEADVKGSVTVQSGTPVVLALILGPLIPIVLIVALIVWLVNRNRRPAPLRV